MFMLVLSIGYVSAQGKADIKFDKTSHNFGTFSENDPVVSCVFTFTNAKTEMMRLFVEGDMTPKDAK